MTLKEQMAADIAAIFLNEDEFADTHTINDRQMLAIVDHELARQRSARQSERYDGIYAAEIVVFTKAVNFEKMPVYGQKIKLDGKLYLVSECVNEGGMLEITLMRNES